MNFQFLLYFFNNSLSKDRQRNMLRETITIVPEDLLELQLSQIAGNENLQEISIVQNYKRKQKVSQSARTCLERRTSLEKRKKKCNNAEFRSVQCNNAYAIRLTNSDCISFH